MPARNCDICGAPIHEFGPSPFCNYCNKVMCPACEKKHNKEYCRADQEFKKSRRQ